MGIIILLSDLIAFFISALLSMGVYQGSKVGEEFYYLSRTLFLPISIAVLILLAINNLYKFHGYVSLDEFKSVSLLVTFSHLIIAITNLFFTQETAQLWILLPHFVFSLALILAFRFSIKHILAQSDRWKLPVVVIGDLDEVEPVIALLKRSRRLFMLPAHVLTYSNPDMQMMHGLPVDLFSITLCRELVSKGLHIAVFVNHNSNGGGGIEQVERATMLFKEVYLVYGRIMLGTLSSRLANLAGNPSIVIRNPLIQKSNLLIKRLSDISICVVFLLVFWPLYLLIAVLVWFTSGRPITYQQERMGKDGRVFMIHKFRSMRQGSQEHLEEVLSSSPQVRSDYQRYRKIEDDPRVTGLGRFLRKFSLDELPQIVNVLKGQMSIVGPRPYTLDEIEPNTPEGKKILSVLPGVTGWWQVMGRNATTFEKRQELDKYYVSNWSLWMDAYILFKTFWVVLSGTGR